MKKNLLSALLPILLFTLTAQPLWAGDVDILIKKLVEKRILTESEARDVLKEMTEEAEKEKAEVKESAKVVPAETAKEVAQKEVKSDAVGLPEWVKKTKLQGDFRFRYQTESVENAPAITGLDIDEQDRWRIRWRLSAHTKVNEQWKVGFGLASGGSDPRSTNQTLRRGFSTGDVRLDYAYANYAPYKWLSAWGGKFKNPIWHTKDLLWDGDIRTEGIAAKVKYSVNPDVGLFFTPAFFVLTESILGEQDDAYMWLLQAGVDWKISDKVSLKFAPTFYTFENLKGTPGPITLAIPTNSRDAEGNLLFDYDAIAFGLESGYKFGGFIPYLGVFGEYVHTFEPDDDETGWLAGVLVGHKELKDFGQWRFKYNYRRLERDAWPDFLPDSDFLFGATNVKGSEVEFSFGLTSHVTIGLDYYFDNKFINTDIEQDLLQIDLLTKW